MNERHPRYLRFVFYQKCFYYNKDLRLFYFRVTRWSRNALGTEIRSTIKIRKTKISRKNQKDKFICFQYMSIFLSRYEKLFHMNSI